MPEESDIRDPFRRRILFEQTEAASSAGPDVRIPTLFETPEQISAVRGQIASEVGSRFDQDLEDIQNRSIQRGTLQTGLTSNLERRAAERSGIELTGELSDFELESRRTASEQINQRALERIRGQEARATDAPRLALEGQIATGQVEVDVRDQPLSAQDFGGHNFGFPRDNALFQSSGRSIRDLQLMSQPELRQLASELSQSPLVARQMRAHFGLGTTTRETVQREGLTEEARQFDITTSEGRRQFDVSTEEGSRQFNEALQEQIRAGNLDREQAAQIASDQLDESMRQFDVSTENGMTQFWTQIREQGRQFDISQEQQALLAANALSENARQFNLSEANDFGQFTLSFNEMIRQFNVGAAQERELALLTLESQTAFQEAQIDISEAANLIDFMQSPAAEALTNGEINQIIDVIAGRAEADTSINAILNMSPDQRRQINVLSTSIAQGARVGGVMASSMGDWYARAISIQNTAQPSDTLMEALLDAGDINGDGILNDEDITLAFAGG